MITRVYVDKARAWNFLPNKLNGLVCQLVTLSRYVHAYIIIKHKKYYFKLESNVGGIYLERINIKSYNKKVDDNKTDLFKHKVKSKFSKEIYNDLKMMLDTDSRIIKVGDYSYWSLLNQFFIKILKHSFIKESKLNGIYPDKMTCSELVHYFHTGKKDSYKIAPVDITLNDDNYKKLR